MNELMFRLLFPGKARQMEKLRAKLLDVVLFPQKNEVREYMHRIKSDYFEARSAGLEEAFQEEAGNLFFGGNQAA